jgi:PAS domain S-box-containing protein
MEQQRSSARQISRFEERNQLLIEAISEIQDYAIFMLNPSGQILTWNAGATRIKGYAESEVVGKHFSIFYTAEDIQKKHPQEELLIAETVGKFQEEGWRLRKDGSRFWASVLITRLTDKDGKLLGFSKITRDLGERKFANDALNASEERFRQLVEGIKDYAIFLLDPEGKVATWNEGAQRLKGYQPSEIIGQHFSKFYPQEEIESGKCEYELQEASLTGRFEDEGWRIRKDGTRFWASVVITVLRDSRGKISGFSKVTRDLTEKKRAEERLMRANKLLEKRVELRTMELTRAKEELERALKVRDEFLSIASHELKTPITSLALLLQMLRSRVNSKTGSLPPIEKIEGTLDRANQQIKKLTNLIEYLLDVTRVELGKFTFDFQKTSLSKAVESAIRHWAEPLRQAGCTLKTRIEPGIHGEIDAYRLDQVISNLVSNIIKYAPKSLVVLELFRSDHTAVIRISDNGPGIDPECLGKVFNRYERAVGQNSASGFGLGLFIANSIVEGHHGQITVESHPGKGTTFTIRIPLNLGRVSNSVNPIDSL